MASKAKWKTEYKVNDDFLKILVQNYIEGYVRGYVKGYLKSLDCC